MIIHPLPAEELDDNTLDKQIIAIAQVLCNVHEVFEEREYEYAHVECTDWGLTCRANYLKLVDMGMACLREYSFRYSDAHVTKLDYILVKAKYHKLQPVIDWARDNMPDLTRNLEFAKADFYGKSVLGAKEEPTPFPLCVPQKYIEYLSSTVRMGQAKPVDIAQSYCNYYRAVLRKDAKWTRREKPYFLAEDWEIVE